MSHKKPKCLILDTYYPDFINSIRFDPSIHYDKALEYVLGLGFGTADFYSRHLRNFGWEVQDVIVNFDVLQTMWARDYGRPSVLDSNQKILDAQIEQFDPDVIFLQALSIFGDRMPYYSEKYFLAAQCSCAVRSNLIPYFDVIFTSFPYYVIQFQRMGVKAILNRLAFEPDVLQHIQNDNIRTRDIVFVGGVGAPSHWAMGMKLLEAVANEFPEQFKWWGYGKETLRPDSPLHRVYQGYAWGLDMYQIYASAKIALNRHGEISRQFANNMRLYETTGCGAMLLTDYKADLRRIFAPEEAVDYRSTNHAVEQIYHYLENEKDRSVIAENGQRRTLAEHTYYDRMLVISDTLMETIL